MLIHFLLVAATLHCTHAISGLRNGTLPGVSQQNAFLGLPLILMQEETAFLVRSGIAHLVPVNTQPRLPSSEELKRHTKERIARLRTVEKDLRRDEAERAGKARERFELGGEKARLKREERARVKAERQRAKAGIVEDGLFQEEAEQATPLSKPARSTTPIPTSTGHFHEVPSHPLFPPLSLGAPITSIPHLLFPFPSTPRDRALLHTYTDLHSKGLRMGLGPRFGGEYLIYPGDYLRFHAHFTSQVLVRDECVRPGEVVGWGRLGTGTKKAGLICCWDDGVRAEEGEGEVEVEAEFYSLEWANFG